jgi:cytochrome c oxidase cbb3-type subunit 4
MELYSALSSAITVLSLCIFIGIVAWAWSGRRREAFANAANAPFALPEEADGAAVLAAARTPR